MASPAPRCHCLQSFVHTRPSSTFKCTPLFVIARKFAAKLSAANFVTYIALEFLSFNMVRRCRQLFRADPFTIRALLLLMLMACNSLGEDYYEVLGLDFIDRPSDSDIKRAYHRMALLHHPDKVAKDDAERAQQDFIKIAAAYEVLGDSAKRVQYDNMRSAHASEQQRQREEQEQRYREETGSSFGGGSRGFYREEDPPPGEGRQEKSTDFFFHVDVSLEAIYTGAHASFSTQVAIVCPICGGSGRCRTHQPLIEGTSDVGSDLQTAHQLAVMHEYHYHDVLCSRCGGLGRLPHDIHQSFYIPPGAHEGMKARIEGTANAQVLVFSTTHDRFIRRDNVHLDYILVITSNEAQLGWSRDIVHLDGRILRVCSGRPSTHGDVVVVPGEGMPVFGSPWQKGDLFVNLSVSMDSSVLLSDISRILLLPLGGITCSSAEPQGLGLLFAPDAFGSGIILQERRLRVNDDTVALLLQGDNITVYTHFLSHDVILYGIDLPLRGTPSSAITVYVSCIHANGDVVSSLFHPLDSQSSALNFETWRTLHFSSPDPIICPAAARVSVQIALVGDSPIFMQQQHSSAHYLFSGSSCTASSASLRIAPHEALLGWLRDHGCNCFSQPTFQSDSFRRNVSCDRAAAIWSSADDFMWMQCGLGIAFVNIGSTSYSVVANATLPHDVRVARAYSTPKALFLLVSVSALLHESSTANMPDGVWRVSVSFSSRGPFLRLRVIPCSSSVIVSDSQVSFAAHFSGIVAMVSSSMLLVISSSITAIRYVRFQSRSAEGNFQVSFVSVHTADDVNVAYGKPVSVSASHPEGAPCSNVVKGQPGARNHPASWHGSSGQDWLEIDLQDDYHIVKVIFYNRKDCCHSRADNALLTLMDASRNVVNTAVLNSDIMQSFTFAEVDTCSVTPNAWGISQVPYAAVFVSDYVLAVLTLDDKSSNVDCMSQMHFIFTKSSTNFWSVCVGVSLSEQSKLLFDREQRLFSLIQEKSITQFDANGIITFSRPLQMGHFISSNSAETLETDIAVIVAREDFYSYCNLFTGNCIDLVSRLGCDTVVLAVARGLRAVIMCNNSYDFISGTIAGCEATSRVSFRLSGCVEQQSHVISTMILHEASNAEARWLWAVSFRLQELFQVLSDITAKDPTSLLDPTLCTQIFSVLGYISAARRSGWLLHPLTRRHLDFLGIQHSIFDTFSCTNTHGIVNNTAVIETLDELHRLHPWNHIPIPF